MTHRFPVRVYYEDTDMGGIVYHANFLKFIERARSAWVRDLGLDQNEMRAHGTIFVVRRVEADFLAPARFDDMLEVVTETTSVTAARLMMDQTVLRAGAPLFHAVVTVVCVGQNGQPVRLPANIRQLLP
ncbi:tol-pal system-associated acyl-CoA thioesterase [Roseovarius autotrophicus]|uniref:tol-pal system-associated acyl-CoA thioesterase n=1 Tax=Roseovarius autotrophicus TaxID=2824121 RepID=UPI0019FED859|nr:tol-pal system-associated acyl-CoA thioesterase [Roseovarius autotrophicus]MBE0453799.1 tol-pal system-associated acyl-CoA thioesterase [Roseovarius sp.]